MVNAALLQWSSGSERVFVHDPRSWPSGCEGGYAVELQESSATATTQRPISLPCECPSSSWSIRRRARQSVSPFESETERLRLRGLNSPIVAKSAIPQARSMNCPAIRCGATSANVPAYGRRRAARPRRTFCTQLLGVLPKAVEGSRGPSSRDPVLQSCHVRMGQLSIVEARPIAAGLHLETWYCGRRNRRSAGLVGLYGERPNRF